MLTKARQILTSELALAKKIDEEEAEKRLDDILAS
jgi:CarD family transcriptional regulator